MSDIDSFSRELFECSKRFLEKAKGFQEGTPEQQAYLRSSLLNACCYLESIVNHVCDHFGGSKQFDIAERALLLEREIEINLGVVRVGKREKFYRLEDRLGFLLKRFGDDFDPNKIGWWGAHRDAVSLRNDLAHPRASIILTVNRVEAGIRGTLEAANYLMTAVFSRQLPYYNLGLAPKYDY